MSRGRQYKNRVRIQVCCEDFESEELREHINAHFRKRPTISDYVWDAVKMRMKKEREGQ